MIERVMLVVYAITHINAQRHVVEKSMHTIIYYTHKTIYHTTTERNQGNDNRFNLQ